MASNSARPRKILLFGATGVIGKYLFEEILAARSWFDKVGVFTSRKTATGKPGEVELWEKEGVEVIVGDVNDDKDLVKAFEGYDTIVSALGRDAILSQIPLLKVAEVSSTIKYFFPSEYGTDIEYGPASPTEKPHQLKLQVREYIRTKTEKLHVTYLVTGPYSDLFFAPASKYEHAGNFDSKNKKATLLGNGNEKISFTTMKDVGRLLVAALKTPHAQRERVLKVNSFTTTGKKALEEFEKQTGNNWDVKVITLSDLKQYEQEAWERSDPMATVFTLRRIWTEGGTLYENRDNDKIGFEGQEETLEEQVRKSIKKHG